MLFDIARLFVAWDESSRVVSLHFLSSDDCSNPSGMHAPHLQWINLCPLTESRKYMPGGRLFGDNAPLLRDFSISASRFRTDASWLPNLSSVTFYDCFTLEDVLVSLQRMPQLSSLTDVDLRGNALNEVATLNAVAILQRITPSPDCCLAMDGPYKRPLPALDPGKNEEYEKAVEAYLVPFLSLHPPSCVSFFLNADMLHIIDSHPPDLDHRNFIIMLYTPLLHFSSLIKELVNSACFSHIVMLDLEISSDYSFDDPANVAITATLAAFTNVKTLLASEHTLRLLLKQPSITSTLFPALFTLQISYPQSRKPGQEESSEPPHQRFLKLRRAVGRPISVLELKTGSVPCRAGNMEYLEEHAGLLVKWSSKRVGITEYVCGSGHPARLRKMDLVAELS
ncbi:hypothetical protein D9613_010849 [Agrocybe pediades]|uniref:Uncharacterized protein n=1 Tax=Agrocybe pediades TaxID=84607 RepID=A0A8H4QME0_9AGAR|nr:hypothetical protein D9613_010849 [Agrocybe pediades]